MGEGAYVGEGFATPEEAARGDIPAQFVQVVGVRMEGDSATVWMLTNEAPSFHAYEVGCERENGRWYMDWGLGGFQTSTPDEVRAEARRLGWPPSG
jgi:hypothetical protein